MPMRSAVGAVNLMSVPSHVSARFLLACLLLNYKIILMNAAGEGKAAERQEGEEEGERLQWPAQPAGMEPGCPAPLDLGTSIYKTGNKSISCIGWLSRLNEKMHPEKLWKPKHHQQSRCY